MEGHLGREGQSWSCVFTPSAAGGGDGLDGVTPEPRFLRRTVF